MVIILYVFPCVELVIYLLFIFLFIELVIYLLFIFLFTDKTANKETVIPATGLLRPAVRGRVD